MANARAAKKAAKAAEAKAVQVKPEVKAAEVKAEVKPEVKAAEIKTEVKPEVKAAEVKAEPAKKVGRPRKSQDAAAKTEKKPAAKSNKAAAKTAKADKEEMSGVNVVVEFNGTQRKVDDIVAKIKDEWVAAGHRLSTIKTLDVYVKPQDYTAYYVINGKIEGKVWM